MHVTQKKKIILKFLLSSPPPCSNQINIRDTALSNDIDNHVIDLLAAHTVSLLFNKVTGPSVRLALSHLFE